MNSTVFGKSAWTYMFMVAAGYRLNETAKEIKDPIYKQFFETLGQTIPCRYCRESYAIFYKWLDIQKYMDKDSDEEGLIRFVYDLKNLVSDKLKKQERTALQEAFNELSKTKSRDDPAFWEIMREKAHKICYTKPAPPIAEVVKDIMQHKVGCSAKMKTCRKSADGINNLSPLFPSNTYDSNQTCFTDAQLYQDAQYGGKQTNRRAKTPVRRNRSMTKRRSSYKRRSRPVVRKSSRRRRI